MDYRSHMSSVSSRRNGVKAENVLTSMFQWRQMQYRCGRTLIPWVRGTGKRCELDREPENLEREKLENKILKNKSLGNEKLDKEILYNESL